MMVDLRRVHIRLTEEQYAQLVKDHIEWMVKNKETVPLAHYIIKQLGL